MSLQDFKEGRKKRIVRTKMSKRKTAGVYGYDGRQKLISEGIKDEKNESFKPNTTTGSKNDIYLTTVNSG